MDPKLWDILEMIAKRKLTLDEVEQYHSVLLAYFVDEPQ